MFVFSLSLEGNVSRFMVAVGRYDFGLPKHTIRLDGVNAELFFVLTLNHLLASSCGMRSTV